jgi:hypothetical protein
MYVSSQRIEHLTDSAWFKDRVSVDALDFSSNWQARASAVYMYLLS